MGFYSAGFFYHGLLLESLTQVTTLDAPGLRGAVANKLIPACEGAGPEPGDN